MRTAYLKVAALEGVSLREKAYRMIKDRIVTCEFLPGCPLNERELVEIIGASRTPIREALNRLEQERLVVITSQKGATVTPITPQIINDIYQLREVIEPHVIAAVVPDFPEDELLRLRKGFAESSMNGNFEELVALDSELHFSIVSAFGNGYLNEFMGNMYTQNERIRFLSTRMPRRLEETSDEHVKIIDAMLTRNPQNAANAMRDHLAIARQVALQL